MLFVDVHAHMDLESYSVYGGIDKLLLEAKDNGVKAVVSNGVDIDSNRKILELAKKHDIIKPALGIYPTHCLEMIDSGRIIEFEEELKFIESQILQHKCFAVGEVGLEYKEIILTDSKKEIQKDCLRKFIRLALKHNVPIILHTRGAELETVELLESEGMKNKKVIMHCFSGRKHIINRIRDNGWFFSIPCNINRSEHFQLIVNSTPISQLLTETDSPYLGLSQGEVNRPDNVRFTINKIAELKQMTKEEVSNIIYSNYQKLFL